MRVTHTHEKDKISTIAELARRPANQKLKEKKCHSQDSAAHAYECVWDAFNVADVGSNTEHTAGQRKQTKQTQSS
ncbi:hypothetical protein TCDM_11872 [Trypanosoma cruzi Dm28c]|uniref:Uncharacterized protein n=1 Tax=Trypanosoma cruzi Dm28c TaxID=1416333 RepID=V5AZC8_TRYCR|nr:hypothetical protein TCDM_11872 [Trypanosoma cruzi Dm28c]